ncbi:DedA family protein [Streptomyces sp. SAS_267]|uniref:DedA family protein n=1 Tax=unclassified Streptomyces TaxID=2593676 RepID=UPI0036FDC1F2
MMTLALGPSWLDPNTLLDNFGIWGLLLVVFAESGLLIGFFLPGDSLLFTCGLLIATDAMDFPLWAAIPLICLAAVLGDQAGYLFGKKVGPSLFTRPDSRLFKQENVVKANEFFEKYGPKSLVLARFVPIVRTFTPIIAGVSGMRYRPFLTFNIIGGVLWGAGVTLLGSWLGKIDLVNKHIELILILIVLVSVVPIMIEFLRARSQAKKNPPRQAEESQDFQEPFPARPEAARTRPAAPVMDDATRPLRVPPVHEDRNGSYGNQNHGAPYGGHGHGRSYGDQAQDQSYGDQGQGQSQSYGNQGPAQPYGDQGHGQAYGNQGQGYGRQGDAYPSQQQYQPQQGYQQPQPQPQQYQQQPQQPYGQDQGYGYDQQQYDQGYQQGYDQDQAHPQQHPQGHPRRQYGAEQHPYGQGPAQN